MSRPIEFKTLTHHSLQICRNYQLILCTAILSICLHSFWSHLSFGACEISTINGAQTLMDLQYFYILCCITGKFLLDCLVSLSYMQYIRHDIQVSTQFSCSRRPDITLHSAQTVCKQHVIRSSTLTTDCRKFTWQDDPSLQPDSLFGRDHVGRSMKCDDPYNTVN